MVDKDKVIGKALYMEFRQGQNTYQAILTPDGLTSDGRSVPATLYRRQISKFHPRKSWKTYALPSLPKTEFGNFKKYFGDEQKSLIDSRASYLENIFSRLETHSYQLYKQPIVVEVSLADLEEVRNARTPYKVLGRITRLRRHLGFGEQLFAE